MVEVYCDEWWKFIAIEKSGGKKHCYIPPYVLYLWRGGASYAV